MSDPENSDDSLHNTSAIDSKDAFIEFVCELTRHLDEHPESCPNYDLYNFLSSLAGWLSSAHNYYRNFDLDVSSEVPSWRLFADCLLAARVYE